MTDDLTIGCFGIPMRRGCFPITPRVSTYQCMGVRPGACAVNKPNCKNASIRPNGGRAIKFISPSVNPVVHTGSKGLSPPLPSAHHPSIQIICDIINNVPGEEWSLVTNTQQLFVPPSLSLCTSAYWTNMLSLIKTLDRIEKGVFCERKHIRSVDFRRLHNKSHSITNRLQLLVSLDGELLRSVVLGALLQT